MFLLKSELHVKCAIGAVLLLTFLIVTTIWLKCISEESDIRLRNKEARNQTDENYFTTEQTKTTLQTKDETEEINTREILLTTEETLISLETKIPINEDETITKKPITPLEARKAYYAVHGRSVSENKCLEFEKDRCKYMREYEKKLVDIFKRPSVPDKDRFGTNARDIAIGSFPHMGSLGWLDTSNNWVFNCAGSLISPNFLLTAAHCTWLSPKKYNLIDPKPQIVRLGNVNILERNSKDYLDVKIQEIIFHPAYKSQLQYSDIALIKLKEEVEFHSHIAPACLTRSRNEVVGDEVLSTGWDYTITGNTSMLEVADIKLLDSKACDENFKVVKDTNFKGIRSHQLCAGILEEKGVDNCQDSSTRFIQVPEARLCLFDVPLSSVIGVTSFGFGCARASVLMPSVYTRLSSFVDWIEENVWKEELNL